MKPDSYNSRKVGCSYCRHVMSAGPELFCWHGEKEKFDIEAFDNLEWSQMGMSEDGGALYESYRVYDGDHCDEFKSWEER